MSSIWDYEDLARHLCGISEDDETADLDDAIFEKFDVDFEQFCKIVGALMPLAAVGQSPLTGKTYQGFANGNCWLAKREVLTSPTGTQADVADAGAAEGAGESANAPALQALLASGSFHSDDPTVIKGVFTFPERSKT